MSYITAILGFFSGFFKAFERILDMLKTKKNIDQGRALEEADIAKREAELNRKETEVLLENRTKDDVAKKLEDGTF